MSLPTGTPSLAPITHRYRICTILLPLALLIAVGAVFFSLLRPGNNFGIDEWYVLYRATHGITAASDRPLSLVLIWLTAPVLHVNPLGYHVLSIAIWIANAYFIFAIVRLFAPAETLFAAACGMLYLVYAQDDFYAVLIVLSNPDVQASTLTALIALWAHFAYMRLENLRPSIRTALLIGSLVLAALTNLIREVAFPLLLGLPVVVFIFERRFTRRRLIGLALWCAGLIASVFYSLMPMLGLREATYTSELFVGFDAAQMMHAMRVQFEFAIDPLNDVGRSSLAPIWPVVVILAAVIAVGMALLIWRCPGANAAPARRRWQHHILWIGGGLLAAWLGYAAYLPSGYAATTWRTQLLSRTGEAVLLGSLIWLGSELVPRKARWLARYGGIMYIGMAGLVVLARQQRTMNRLDATWEDTGRFMRSMGEQIPGVKAPTLLIYMQNPTPSEVPFTGGHALQYIARYFYEDQATGYVADDNILGDVTMRDDGIFVSERDFGERLYGWDEIIVFSKHDDGTVYILDRLPERWYTSARQGLYDPDGRIEDDGVLERIQRVFPP